MYFDDGEHAANHGIACREIGRRQAVVPFLELVMSPRVAGRAGLMSEAVKSGVSPTGWSPNARPLAGSMLPAPLTWGGLCLRVFAINIAVVMLAWLLVSLMN
jgi:hypothetical protein